MLSRFRNGNPFLSLYDFLSDASICHLEERGASMYTIFPSIIGGRVAFFDFHNGIMNLIE